MFSSFLQNSPAKGSFTLPVNKYVKTDPAFYVLIKGAMAVVTVVVVVLAAIFPAPLLPPADVAHVPNPSRAAWFLIWMQELVSYSKYAIYPIILFGAVLAFLPWLPWLDAGEREHSTPKASWYPRGQRLVNWLATIGFVLIVALTVVALWFRGENWAFGWFF